MNTYVCRFVVPNTGKAETIEAESPEAAGMTFHYNQDSVGLRYKHKLPGGFDRHEYVFFALVAVANQGGSEDEFVSRVFRSGLWRRGGIPTHPDPTLVEIAVKLGWKDEPNELLGEGWAEEESYETARARQ